MFCIRVNPITTDIGIKYPCIVVEEPSIHKETMVFSVSRQNATELAVLVSFAAFTVCCAGFFQRNETGMAEQETSGMETISSK